MDTGIQPAPLVTGSRRRGSRGATLGKPRSLPITEWPKSVRLGWQQACRSGHRLQRGGAASRLARVSRADYAHRLGLYLDFLQRNRLVEAGLLLVKEAEMFGKTPLARAIGARNGLIIALLALHPIRIKNFAAFAIGDTFVNVDGRWWLHVPADDTKSNFVDQRQVPEFITDTVNKYVTTHRMVLNRGNAEERALWVSSTTGRQMTAKNLGTLISKLTRKTIGVDVSPHLFRTAGASTAAVYGRKYPYLGIALLGHRDPRVNEEHYNRATSLEAGDTYASITEAYRSRPKGQE
jgi:hypothetical protein